MTQAEKATEPRHSPTGPQPGRAPFLLGHTTIFALTLLLLATLIGLYSLFPSSESTAARVARTGVIRIGYAVEAPFAFVDGQGWVTGESPAVARVIWNGSASRTSSGCRPILPRSFRNYVPAALTRLPVACSSVRIGNNW